MTAFSQDEAVLEEPAGAFGSLRPQPATMACLLGESANRQLGPSVIDSPEETNSWSSPSAILKQACAHPPSCRHLVPPGASCMSSPAVQPPLRTPEKPQRGQKIGLEVTSWHS